MSKVNTKDQEQYELFFLMEKKHKLFDIRTLDGLPVWDIVRYMVSYYLAYKDVNISKNNASKSIIIALKENFFYATRNLFIFFWCFWKKTPNFQFGVSKIKNSNGEFYDPYYNSIKNITPGEFVFYESVFNKDKYSKDNRCFDILPILKKIIFLIPGYSNRMNKKNEIVYDQIKTAIVDFFGIELIDESEINKMLNEFRIEYWFYKFFLNFKKVERVFVTQNGVQKALFKAASELKIPTYEFQHGDIVSSTLLYNYGNSEFNVNKNIIYPDVLFTFSNIWEFDKYIPSKCIEIGSQHFRFKAVSESSKKKGITIITSNEYNEVLQSLAIEIANAYKNTKVFYKLHPSQFDNLLEQQNYFCNHKNIEVVSTNLNISDLLEISDEFVVIYSTVMYEVLQAGRKVYILRLSNYKSFKSYFDLPNVYLFDCLEDLIILRRDTLIKKSNNNIPVFFKPFNKNAFVEAIK